MQNEYSMIICYELRTLWLFAKRNVFDSYYVIAIVIQFVMPLYWMFRFVAFDFIEVEIEHAQRSNMNTVVYHWLRMNGPYDSYGLYTDW